MTEGVNGETVAFHLCSRPWISHTLNSVLVYHQPKAVKLVMRAQFKKGGAICHEVLKQKTYEMDRQTKQHACQLSVFSECSLHMKCPQLFTGSLYFALMCTKIMMYGAEVDTHTRDNRKYPRRKFS